MVQDIYLFLKDLYPFSILHKDDIQRIASNIQIEYYPKGETIFSTNSPPLEFLYIIRKGEVILKIGEVETDYLEEGDVFGYPSLLSGQSPTKDAVVERDSILYLLPKGIFFEYIEKDERFKSFFSYELTKRLNTIVELVRSKDSSVYPRASLERFLLKKLKELNIRAVPLLSPETSVSEAARVMIERNATCVFVGESKPVGIVTERDMIKKVVSLGLDPNDVSLEDIQTVPIIYKDEDSLVFEGLLEMANRNMRRIAVSKDGVIIGVIEDRDIIMHENKSFIIFSKQIDKAKEIAELKRLNGLVIDMIESLYFDGVRIDYIMELIAEINDKIIKNVARIILRGMGKELPAPFALMVLGSEGRREQTIKTDQDNALIYEEHNVDLESVDEFFREFGERFNNALDEIGFPLCPGEVMVRNPEWRLSKSRWFDRVSSWIDSPTPDNILKVGIFFDFRYVYGDEYLVDELREFVAKEVPKKDVFVGYMLLSAIVSKPPTGIFGFLKKEIDIKKYGIFPITQAARALSLKFGIRDTNTIKRIKKLIDAEAIPEKLGNEVIDFYLFLQGIKLKNNLESMKQGEEPTNIVDMKKLGKLEHTLLKDAFKVIGEFQSYLDSKYAYVIPR